MYIYFKPVISITIIIQTDKFRRKCLLEVCLSTTIGHWGNLFCLMG